MKKHDAPPCAPGMLSISPDTLREIRRCTKINDHGEAIVVAAKALGCKDMAEKVKAINRTQLRLGHLPHRLYEDRFGIYNELLSFAKMHLNHGQYKALHAAF